MRTNFFARAFPFRLGIFALLLASVGAPALAAGPSDPVLPTVSIEATVAETTEPAPNVRVMPGKFTLKRVGDATTLLRVFLNYEGSARADADYQALPREVEFQPGNESVDLLVAPFEDSLAEGVETVVAELAKPPSGSSSTYLIDPLRSIAKVMIMDGPATSQAMLEILRPKNEETFPVGAVIPFSVRAVDPAGYISRAEFYEGQALIGFVSVMFFRAPDPGEPTLLNWEWKDAPPGKHLVYARAQDTRGNPVESSAVLIYVGATDATLEMTSPRDGSSFPLGATVLLAATAVDPSSEIREVGFYDGEQLIGVSRILTKDAIIPGRPRLHSFEWTGATAGTHQVQARAKDSTGRPVVSQTVKVLIFKGENRSFVERTLPAAYLAGESFLVSLRAEPPPGSGAYALEDVPPAGWPVSEISDEGAVDPYTGSVKFGPFIDGGIRTLTYRVFALAGATGVQVFKGVSALDGRSYPILGDQFIDRAGERHPADLSPADNRITMTELTAYAAAWKENAAWPSGPSPISMAFVTRAGVLWKGGETYIYDPALGEPPLCWRNENPSAIPVLLDNDVQREVAPMLKPGEPGLVTIRVRPEPGITAYAVEENLPSGWQVSAVDQEGRSLAGGGTIRWGPFLGDQPRVLQYQVTPPSGLASAGLFRGKAAFDGRTVSVGGANRAGAADAQTALRIGAAERLPDQGVRLRLHGPPGQVCVVETSEDLIHWEPLDPVIVGAEGSVASDVDGSALHQRFYRLRAPTSRP